MYERNERRSFVPVKIGEELNVKIEAVGEKGDGVAKVNGFVLFVPNAKQGDTVKVRVTKVLRKMGFAEIVGNAEPKAEGEEEASEEEPKEEESQKEETQSEDDSEDDESEDSEDFGDEE